MHNEIIINSFHGDHSFLSNFHPATVILDGTQYPTVEHAYQAAKTLDIDERDRIRQVATAGHAKRMGRLIMERRSQLIKEGMYVAQ